MAIEFTQLIEPQTLTTGLSLLIISLFAIFAYLGFRLRSAAILLFWTIDIIVFVLSILINLSFIWFWVMIILTVMVVSVASIFVYVVEPSLDN